MIDASPIRVTTVSQEVYHRLRLMITSGELRPGAVVTLRSLGQALDVSTTPVREALRRLESQGLVQYGRHSVTITSLSAEEVLALFQIRFRLEQLAAEWALEKVTETDLAEIGEVLEQLETNEENPDQWRILNQDFHRRFYDCADSPHLLEYIRQVWMQIEPYMAIYASSKSDHRDSNVEHRQIFAAITSGDLNALLALTSEHLNRTAEQIIYQLRQIDSSA